MLRFSSAGGGRAPDILRIDRFRGINKASTATQIDLSESPDCLNIVLDENGKPDKRTGYSRVYTTSLGAGQINGMYRFRKIDGTTVFLIAWGTGLYTQTGSNQPASIYSGLANSRVRFFTFGDKCYILDGTHYLVYDGATVVDVSTVAYVPTLQISTPPAGGGTAFEDFNLLTSAFKQSFSGDGVATAYQLSLTALDATAVTATVDGVVKVETTDFTVNRTTGIVTFTAAPATGTNNVVITAYKTVSGKADLIKKCTDFELFGGGNDSRVFFYGHPLYPNTIRRSGVVDPTYAPENGFEKVGSDASRVMKLRKQYDVCVILKEPSPIDNTIWRMSYDYNDGINVRFPIVPVNDAIGCIASNAVEVIENLPTFISGQGAYQLSSSNVRDERNVQHISINIDHSYDVTAATNRALMDEENLDRAVSADFEHKWIIAANGYAYVMDYKHKYVNELGQIAYPWFIWDNIPASCFLEMDGYLYFGSNSQGLVYKFKKRTDLFPYNDDGVAINEYWKSKEISFGADEFLKIVEKVFFSLKPDTRTSADLYYITDRVVSSVIASPRVDLFDFNNIDFSKYSFLISVFPQEIVARVKAKKIVYFQLVLQNNHIDESMGILSIGLKYQFQREVK